MASYSCSQEVAVKVRHSLFSYFQFHYYLAIYSSCYFIKESINISIFNFESFNPTGYVYYQQLGHVVKRHRFAIWIPA